MEQAKVVAKGLMPIVNEGKRQIINPLEDVIGSVELIRHSGSDLDIVNAARVSYGKVADELTDRDAKLINFLMMHDHTSPFEHNQLSFRIKAPLYVVRQWMRHRMNSYNEISYRYVKAPLEFYTPKHWRYQDKDNRQSSFGAFSDPEVFAMYKKGMDASVKAYEDMLAAGVCREQARGILPVCTYTEFIFTCNLHSFFHFIKLRIKSDAQYEIQMYARAMLQLAKPHFPAAFAAFAKKHNLVDYM